MISNLIDRYKQHRKHNFLKQYQSYNSKYAFIGVGNHSLSNLYPIIDYLGVPLKYICTRSIENATQAAVKYPNATATNNLEQLLNDEEVKGVFLCSSPTSHFDLAKKILSSGKHLFVEKPPCLAINELEALINLASDKLHVVVGLQKPYATVATLLNKNIKSPISYHYRYTTGAYPEGNPVWDLFIHPLSLATYLFGPAKVVNSVKNRNTFLVTLQHENAVIGQLELSTDYSWQSPIEQLAVNTGKGEFWSDNLNHLAFRGKNKEVAGIPLEKIFKTPIKTETLLDNTGFIPIAENNSLKVQGYFDEIKTFVSLVEGHKAENKTTLKSLLPTFKVIEKLVSY